MEMTESLEIVQDAIKKYPLYYKIYKKQKRNYKLKIT